MSYYSPRMTPPPPPAGDRRENHSLRSAICRLRLCEFLAGKHLPLEQALELSSAIDALVSALRQDGAL